MIYVEKARKYSETMEQKEAISLAIDECVQEGILEDFFKRNKTMIISTDVIDATHEALMEFAIQDSAKKDAMIAEKDAEIAKKDATIADKEAMIADMKAEIARLKENRLEE